MQGGVSDGRKAADVKDYPKAAVIRLVSKDLEFPADKMNILEYAKEARSSE